MRQIEVDIGGKKYQIASDDTYLDYISKGFEPEMVSLFRTLVADTDVVMDVGANIGATAILFGELCNAVYAFEPSPTTFGFLKGNVEKAGLTNVYPQNMGLGADVGEAQLAFSSVNRSGAFVANQIPASQGHVIEKISIETLDHFVESFAIGKIDFIKLDVEGFEGDVIRGAQAVLRDHQPIVVLELNHWCLNAFQRTSIPDFFDQLRAVFPILYAVDGAGYLDLHNDSDSFEVMYHHILHMRFPNLVAGFSTDHLTRFRAAYSRGFQQ